jgi:F0F1-type ATP synthase assembly protein I
MSYSKAALGTTAVSALVTPIVVLCLGGYWLDMRLKHATPWFAMIGVIVGLVLGLTSMMKILEKISK